MREPHRGGATTRNEEEGPHKGLTLRDLAASLGVSKTTVSNAFSRPDQLSPELRTRVLDAARRAGYAGPHAVARMLRTRRSGAIGLILPESLPFALDDDAANEIVRGIADACEERRLGLLVVPGVLHSADPRTITDVAVDGFVAYSLPRDAPGLAAALGRHVSLVIVDQPRIAGATTVGIDDAAGAFDLAAHLVALGHRRFGIVSLPFRADDYTGPGEPGRIAHPTFDVGPARLDGYREALADAGIAMDEVPIFECGHSSEDLGAQAGRYLFGLPERPTAILAMSDRLAMGVLAAARAAGLAVPTDVSIAGFDDVPSAAHVRPALTTVRQPHRLKGYAAARLLLDGAGHLGSDEEAPRPSETDGAGGAPEDRLDLPIELVVRRSTGAPPASAR